MLEVHLRLKDHEMEVLLVVSFVPILCCSSNNDDS